VTRALDALLASDMVDHNPMPDQPPGLAGFKVWMAAARSSFPDFNCTVETVLSEGDLVAGFVIWRGTQRGSFLGIPPTNKPVAVKAFHIVRIDDGLIAEWWGNADFLGAIEQLGGQIVPPTDTALPD
jgi:predicted ester cyclase